jgi:hypothetical protein
VSLIHCLAGISGRLVLATLVCVLAGSAHAQLSSYGLSDAQLSEIQKGEVVVIKLRPPKDAGVKFRAFQKLEVEGRKLQAIMVDCDKFDQFMPRTLSSSISDRTDNGAICDVLVDMPFPFDDLRSVVKTRWGRPKPGVWTRSWTLLSGSFNCNEGSWTVLSTPKHTESIVVYEASVDPKVSIPDFILRTAQVNTVPNLMQSLLNRARTIK